MLSDAHSFSAVAVALKGSIVTSPNRIWNLLTKNIRPLERKGSCLKGEKCDFFHKPTHFQQQHYPNYYENPAFLEPLEVGLRNFNITGTGPQQIPTPMGLNRCRPTAMPLNQQLLRPLMSIPHPYFYVITLAMINPTQLMYV